MTKEKGGRSFLVVASLLLIAAAAGAAASPVAGWPEQKEPAAAAAQPRGLRLHFPAAPRERAGLSAGRWNGRRLEPLEAIVEQHADGSMVQIATRCSGGATLQVTAERWISRPVPLSAAECAAGVIELEWLPAATLQGKVAVPRGEQLPDFGRLEVARCPLPGTEEAVFVGEYPARFQADGSWAAQVPAGCLDVTLSVPPFAPLLWSAVQSEQGAEVEVRPRELIRGANLTALIVDPDGGRGIAGVLVSLVPEAAFETAAEAAYAGRIVDAQRWQRSDVGGWIRFEAVPSGIYYLIAQATGRTARSPGFSEAVELVGGDDVVVDPVEVPVPASLRIEVRSQDEDALRNAKLIARALPILGSSILSHSVRIVEFGAYSSGLFEALVPGRWRVSIRGGASDRSSTLLGEEEVVLTPGSSETLDFELEATVFHGRVTYRGDPLAGTLRLHPEQEQFEGSFPHTESDDEGRFTVWTDPGRYTVQFMAASGKPTSSVIPRVLFEDPEELVEVELPDGRIEGVVIDAEGNPVAGAAVTARGLRSGAEDRVDSIADFLYSGTQAGGEGRFELEALGEGRWTLVARKESLESEPLVTELAIDQYLPGVELVLRESLSIAGAVVNERGEPVQGAVGTVFLPPSRPWELSPGQPIRTDPEGRFELHVRSSLRGRAATVSIGARGHARTVARATVGRRMRVLLPQASGRVELTPKESWAPGDYTRLCFVAADGAGVILQELISVGRGVESGVPFPGSPRPVVIPDLAPGAWRLVRLNGTYAEVVALLEGQGHLLPELATFTVQAGTTTQVEVPSEEWSGGRPDHDRGSR